MTSLVAAMSELQVKPRIPDGLSPAPASARLRSSIIEKGEPNCTSPTNGRHGLAPASCRRIGYVSAMGCLNLPAADRKIVMVQLSVLPHVIILEVVSRVGTAPSWTHAKPDWTIAQFFESSAAKKISGRLLEHFLEASIEVGNVVKARGIGDIRYSCPAGAIAHFTKFIPCEKQSARTDHRGHGPVDPVEIVLQRPGGNAKPPREPGQRETLLGEMAIDQQLRGLQPAVAGIKHKIVSVRIPGEGLPRSLKQQMAQLRRPGVRRGRLRNLGDQRPQHGGHGIFDAEFDVILPVPRPSLKEVAGAGGERIGDPKTCRRN